MQTVINGAAIGIGATIILDLWFLLLKALFAMPFPKWGMPGRWLYNLKNGQFTHADIAAAEPFSGEVALGWALHYTVGIVFGILLGIMVGQGWFAQPTLLPALAWGIVTVAAGWFIMQPGLGAGVAASKTPSPWKIRRMNLLNHVVFGFGLWLTALALSPGL